MPVREYGLPVESFADLFFPVCEDTPAVGLISPFCQPVPLGLLRPELVEPAVAHLLRIRDLAVFQGLQGADLLLDGVVEFSLGAFKL